MKGRHGAPPRDVDLYVLLTSPALEGLEVRFASGLTYRVGAGFRDPAGRPLRRDEAYPLLRVAYEQAAVYPARRGRHPAKQADTSHT